jgi:hypothetical protein
VILENCGVELVWINQARDWVQWRDFATSGMSIRVPDKREVLVFDYRLI